MSKMENEPLGKRGSPFAVGVLALTAAGLSALIYEVRGTWPAESGGLTALLFVAIGVALIGYAWRVE